MSLPLCIESWNWDHVHGAVTPYHYFLILSLIISLGQKPSSIFWLSFFPVQACCDVIGTQFSNVFWNTQLHMKINRKQNSRDQVKNFLKASLARMLSCWTGSCFETPTLKSGLMCSVIRNSCDFQLMPSPLQIISEDISELQKNQTTTMAKIAQYKRKLMALSHRTLQVTRVV